MVLAEVETIIAIAVSLLVLLKPVRSWGGRVWKKTLGRRGAQLDRIEAELRPNGGNSLSDTIFEIKASVARVEDRQAEFDAFLKAQLNIHHTAVFRADQHGKWTYANRQHQRLTGFSFPEVAGDGWINIIHPSDRNRVYDAWREAVTGGREFSEDIRYLSPAGEEYLVHVNVYRELDNQSQVRGYLGVVTPRQSRCPYKGVCDAEIQER